MTREQINRMIDAYLDGDLGEDDGRRLTEILRAGGEDAGWALSQIEATGLISLALDDLDSEAFLRGFFERLRAESDADDFIRDFAVKSRSKTAVWNRPRVLRWAVALAASFLVGLALIWWFPPGPVAAQAIAKVEQVTGEVFILSRGNRLPACPGQALLPGQGLEVTGEDSLAVLVFPDATCLEIGGGSAFPELSGAGPDARPAKKITLTADSLVWAEVPDQPAGRPMLLSTPDADVWVQDGCINLTSAAEGTHLVVDRGEIPVRLTRKKDGKSIEMGSSCTALVSSVADSLTPQPQAPRITKPRSTFRGHSSYVMSVAFSPDGQMIASADHAGTVRCWQPSSGEERYWRQRHTNRIWCLAYSPTGLEFASGGRDHAAILWDARTGEARHFFEQKNDVLALAFSPDGTLLVQGTQDGMVQGSDVETGRSHFQLSVGPKRGHGGAVRGLWFSADGQTLAAASSEGHVHFWDVRTSESRRSLQLVRSVDRGLTSLAFSPDGTRLASGQCDGSITVWDTGTGQALARLYGHWRKVLALAFSPDGRYLASGSVDSTARLWDVGQAHELATFITERTGKQVNGVAFSPDGQTLATASVDKTVKLWAVPR